MWDGRLPVDALAASALLTYAHPMDTSLQSALDHLKAFRATFNDGDPVDEESGLTADDLTIVIDHCDRPVEDVAAEALGGFA